MATAQEAREYLDGHGIQPSYHRVRIMQYLLGRRSHPTIDEIYQALLPEIPTLSKTTVYNTLGLFIRKNVAISLSIEENQLRYDADVLPHGHFLCEKCGRVFDFRVDAFQASGLCGFEIHSKAFFLKGLCPDCEAKASLPEK